MTPADSNPPSPRDVRDWIMNPLVAIVILGICLFAIQSMNGWQSGYAKAKSIAHCQAVLSQLDMLEQSAGRAPSSLAASRLQALRDALVRCESDVVAASTFKGFAPKPDTSAAAVSSFTEAVLAPDGWGQYAFRVTLGLFYVLLATSTVVLLLWVLHLPLLDGLREGVVKAAGKDERAKAVASFLAPALVAAPLVTGVAVAVRPDPVSLAIAPAKAEVTISPRLLDGEGQPVTQWSVPIAASGHDVDKSSERLAAALALLEHRLSTPTTVTVDFTPKVSSAFDTLATTQTQVLNELACMRRSTKVVMPPALDVDTPLRAMETRINARLDAQIAEIRKATQWNVKSSGWEPARNWQ